MTYARSSGDAIIVDAQRLQGDVPKLSKGLQSKGLIKIFRDRRRSSLPGQAGVCGSTFSIPLLGGPPNDCLERLFLMFQVKARARFSFPPTSLGSRQASLGALFQFAFRGM